MPLKIALLGIYHESNTFVPIPTTLPDFQKGHYLKGDAIRSKYQEAHHEIGGMIEVMDQEGMEVVPVLYAEATPEGTVSAETYQLLLDDMMQDLEKALPVDGCLVVPHGAGVSEDFPDLDGHKKLEAYLIDHRDGFIGCKNDIPSSVALIKDSKKPVLLLDMGDNAGGGATGDNTCLLEALKADGRYQYFICICDPQAVAEAAKHEAGDTFDLSLSGLLSRLPDHYTSEHPRSDPSRHDIV